MNEAARLICLLLLCFIVVIASLLGGLAVWLGAPVWAGWLGAATIAVGSWYWLRWADL